VSTRVFLLSPATCGGERAQMVMSPRASFPLARQLRTREGAPLGDVFSFLSGLYFRGKLAYARAFAAPPTDAPGVLVITPDAGLRPPEVPLTRAGLRAAARVDISVDSRRYRRPLERDARALAAALPPETEIVLLGSIATDKYLAPLGAVFGERLAYPLDFAGRGDMSRGALLLRCVAARSELAYAPASSVVRRPCAGAPGRR
jgi:hypothetical protein